MRIRHPGSSPEIHDRASSRSTAIAVRSAQFSISVRPCAFLCVFVRSAPPLGSPPDNVNHRRGMKRLKKGKVPVKFSTRDATRPRRVRHPVAFGRLWLLLVTFPTINSQLPTLNQNRPYRFSYLFWTDFRSPNSFQVILGNQK
jgi:hypothetical protein